MTRAVKFGVIRNDFEFCCVCTIQRLTQKRQKQLSKLTNVACSSPQPDFRDAHVGGLTLVVEVLAKHPTRKKLTGKSGSPPAKKEKGKIMIRGDSD